MALDAFCEHDYGSVGSEGDIHPIASFDFEEVDRRLSASEEEETEASKYAEALISFVSFHCWGRIARSRFALWHLFARNGLRSGVGYDRASEEC
jgi:hypothetical protein